MANLDIGRTAQCLTMDFLLCQLTDFYPAFCSHRLDLLAMLETFSNCVWWHYVPSIIIDLLHFYECHYNLLNGLANSGISLSNWNDSVQCCPKDKCGAPIQVCDFFSYSKLCTFLYLDTNLLELQNMHSLLYGKA